MSNTQQTAPSIVARLVTWWNRWVSPHSANPDDAFRERTIRGMVPILAFVVLAAGFVLANVEEGKSFFIALGMALILVAATVAITRQRINLAAVLIILFPVFASAASLLSSGYWSFAGIIMAYVSVLLGAIVLPRRIMPFLPIAMILGYALVAFVVNANGLKSPYPPDNTFGTPGGAIIEVTILSSLFFGIGYYLLNELEQRRKALSSLIESLEDRVAQRTRDLQAVRQWTEQLYHASQGVNAATTYPDILTAFAKEFGPFDFQVTLILFEPPVPSDLNQVINATGVAELRPGQALAEPLHTVVPIRPEYDLRTPEVIDDTSCDENAPARYYRQYGLAAIAIVGFSVGSRTIGAIRFSSTTPHVFGNRDRGLLLAMGELAAAAVERSRSYADQVQLAERLRELDNVKSRFLASMSHELRTPLNAVLNFSKFVATGMFGPVNDRQADALNKSINSGKHLLALINDVLDITKIESGMLTLFIEADIDLKEELENIATTAETLLVDKPDVHLVCVIPDALPKFIGDKRRIHQVLLNLVSNACKFTRRGSVTIGAEIQGATIVLSVKDTGPGIAPSDQQVIFEPFRQTVAGLSQGSGTGLGLAIAKRLVEAHEGRLWLESAPGKGSSFFVQLPLQSEALRAQIVTPQED